MSQLQVFKNSEFGEMRTVWEDGKPLFCGSDVAKSLGYAKPQNAIAAHCKGALKRSTPTSGGKQEMSFIPEGDLYRLITHSKLPSAERFECWVFDEVLPSIRKYGIYATQQTIEAMLQDPDTMIKTLQTLKEERNKRITAEKQITEDKPYTDLGKAISQSDDGMLIGNYTKLLANVGVHIGQNGLFAWFRENGYLCSRGQARNKPKQEYLEQGLFRLKPVAVNTSQGSIIKTTTLITGKGQSYFTDKLKANI